MLLGQCFDHKRIPQAHGGEKPVDHEQGFALAARVVSQLHVADLRIFNFGFEVGVERLGLRERDRCQGASNFEECAVLCASVRDER